MMNPEEKPIKWTAMTQLVSTIVKTMADVVSRFNRRFRYPEILLDLVSLRILVAHALVFQKDARIVIFNAKAKMDKNFQSKLLIRE